MASVLSKFFDKVESYTILATIRCTIVSIVTFGLRRLLMSKNFTIKKGNFRFFTDDQEFALNCLKEEYKKRMANLKKKSKDNYEKVLNQEVLEDQKEAVIKKTISFYLAPTSQNCVFGHDVIIFNGKHKPTIMLLDEFTKEVRLYWTKTLQNKEGLLPCIDEHQIGTKECAFDEKTASAAQHKCWCYAMPKK